MSTGSKPNILMIVIDAARADHFSCYGYPKKTSPFIDEIAAEGVVYENAISAAGWTLPSHTSMFTGTYVSKHGVHNENHVFGDELPTMPEVLQKDGYHTVGFCTNDWLSAATGLTRGFTEFYNYQFSIFKHKAKRFVNSIFNRGKDSWGYQINKDVNSWLKLYDYQKPFFMFVHLNELHLPYQLPAPFNSRFLPEGMTYEEASRVNQNPKAFYAGVEKMTERDFEISRGLYDCAINYSDYRINELYQQLKKMNVLDDTLLIITSDHGESIGDHGHFDHYYVLYEALVKVPLIMRYPKVFPSGTRYKELVQTMDFLPTLKEMLHLNDPELNVMQGVPLPPLNSKTGPREFAIAERFKDLAGLKKSYPDMDLKHLESWELDRKIAYRTQKYKLISSENYDSELYDIESDPNELHNLIHEKKDVAENLQKQIEAWRSTFKAAETEGKAADFDDAMRKRLESLGYLG